MRYRVLIVVAVALLCLLCLALAQLPSPLTSHADTALIGQDCTEWCLNGTVDLQPRQFGSTNEYCTDSRGCWWLWRLRIVPCSMSLLSFDAEIGPNGALYSAIDSAAHASLAFYCSDSDGGATLAVRAFDSITPLMQWRYTLTTCDALLGDLAARTATFAGADTSVVLGAQEWFGNSATRLEDNEVECDAAPQQAVLEACEQCFAGVQSVSLPNNATAELATACGYMPGAALGDCDVRWHFCYDACRDSASQVDVRLGSGTALRHISERAGRAMTVRAGELDDRGRAVVALTDAGSVERLDAGEASFYFLWEYRAAPMTALWRASLRDGLFVSLHFAMLLDTGERLEAPTQTGSGTHSLSAYAWDGKQATGIAAVAEAAKSLNSREAGLVAAVVVVGVLCLLGWALAALFGWRLMRHTAGSGFVPVHTDSELGIGAGIAAPLSDWDQNVARAREVVRKAEEEDTAHLTMDGEELRRHYAQRDAQVKAARDLLQRDYERRGGHTGAVMSAVGLTPLISSYQEGRREFQKHSTAHLLAQHQQQQTTTQTRRIRPVGGDEDGQQTQTLQ